MTREEAGELAISHIKAMMESPLYLELSIQLKRDTSPGGFAVSAEAFLKGFSPEELEGCARE